MLANSLIFRRIVEIIQVQIIIILRGWGWVKEKIFGFPGLGIIQKLKPIGLGPILRIVSSCSGSFKLYETHWVKVRLVFNLYSRWLWGTKLNFGNALVVGRSQNMCPSTWDLCRCFFGPNSLYSSSILFTQFTKTLFTLLSARWR